MATVVIAFEIDATLWTVAPLAGAWFSSSAKPTPPKK